MIIMTLALALQASQPDALAGDWLVIHESAEGRIEIDEGGTRRDGDLVRLRMRGERLRATSGIRWELAEFEFNCRTRRSREVSFRHYDAAGALLDSASRAELDAMSATPLGDDGLRTLEAACHRTGWGEEGQRGVK